MPDDVLLELNTPISLGFQLSLPYKPEVAHAAADTLLPQACQEICELLHADWTMFWQLNPTRDQLALTAEYNLLKRKAVGIRVELHGDTITQHLLETQTSAMLEDVSQGLGQLFTIVMQCDMTSLLMLPILMQHQTIGVMCVCTQNPRVFLPEEQSAALRVLRFLSPALELQRFNESLQQELQERRIAEYQLRMSKTKFFDFVNSLEGIVFEGCLRDGVPQLTFVSQNTENMLGYRFEHWFHEPALYVRPVHPDDRDRVREALTRTMTDHSTPFDEEYRLRRADGSIIWVRTQARVDLEENLFWRGLTTDITALKQQQLFERERNRVLELLAQGAALSDVLQSIVHVLHQQFRVPCGIVQYEENEMLFRANVGIAKIIVPYLERIQFKGRAQSVYAQLKTGDSYSFAVKSNILFAADLRQLLNYAELGFVSIRPIRLANGQTWGGMVFFSSTDQQHLIRDSKMTSISSLATIAIEQHRLLRSLEQQATHDQLTNLPNRSLYNQRLLESIAHAKRHRDGFALLNIDLNFFKQVNDTFGHSSGDELLVSVAQALTNTVLATHTVARLGGDEFCIIAPNIRQHSEAESLVQRLKSAIAQISLKAAPDFRASASIGIAIFPNAGNTPEELYHVADQDMYQRKLERHNGTAPVTHF